MPSPREGGPSFPLSHRLFRALWSSCWLALGAWTPPPFAGWRRLLLVVFGAKLAPTARVYGSARVWYPPHLRMAAHSVLGPRCDCYCMAKVTLGAHATVSQGARLCAGSHDVDDPEFPIVSQPIVIGADAWIAAEAFVGPGVTVGEGAVLGARGVAFSDLAPWTIYASNPAKPLRLRKHPGRGAASR